MNPDLSNLLASAATGALLGTPLAGISGAISGYRKDPDNKAKNAFKTGLKYALLGGLGVGSIAALAHATKSPLLSESIRSKMISPLGTALAGLGGAASGAKAGALTGLPLGLLTGVLHPDVTISEGLMGGLKYGGGIGAALGGGIGLNAGLSRPQVPIDRINEMFGGFQ